MKISNDVANVLGNSQIDNEMLYLPDEQLERSLYMAVNKVLVAIGGKWNRKEKAHLFKNPVSETLEEILLTGEYTDAKKEYQLFETPSGIAKQLVDMAEIQPGESILEPSAGKGAIAKYINEDFSCDCIELNPENRQYLTENGFYLVGDDFLQCSQKYDVIIANPPFTKQQDIEHVTHMIELARYRVVSVMSNSIQFRTNKKTLEFRKLLDRYDSEIIDLPENSFKESGTGVQACIIRCWKDNN